MAETYNISVTLDDFNGIITKNPNGDGTYNVTYANLTNGQIEAIGTAIKTAMQTSLKEVALSGEYNDLNVKPGIPSGYTQESNFSSVAFSGKASDLNNTDDDDKEVFLTKAVFDTTEASKITDGKIAEWDAKSNFSGDYNDLNPKPNLNASDPNTNISGLASVAISGDYNDLNNIPTINLYLSTFSNTLLSENENNILHNLGTEDTYILNYNTFTNAQNISLKDTLDNAISKILQQNYKCYIISNLYNFLITNVQYVYNNNEIIYYILDTISFHQTNYDNIRYSSNNFSETVAEDQLTNINIINKNIIFIIDREYNVIYCKIKQ